MLTRGVCTATVDGSTAHLSIAQARYASIIVAGSVRHGMPPRAASIALATAFQESGIRNLDYGHADSVGLFQQRPSQGWGTVAQIMNPYYATDRFYQALAQVPDYTGLDIADAAQRVQRSADGSLYGKHEQRARTLASAMTGQTPAAWTCEPGDRPDRPWSLRQLESNLTAAFGAGVPVSRRADTLVVRLPRSTSPASTASSERWAIANWAVANLAVADVQTVQVNGQRWRRGHARDGWTRAQAKTGDLVVIGISSAH